MECTGIQENSARILTKYIQYVSPSGTLLTRPPRILERLEKDPVEASIFLFSQPQHTHTHTQIQIDKHGKEENYISMKICKFICSGECWQGVCSIKRSLDKLANVLKTVRLLCSFALSSR